MIRWLLLILILTGPLFAEEEGFIPLFNGRDLTGWVNVNGASETWKVQDGMLHCDGIPAGALRTERQYENFILELEWRHLVPAGNAGVFIWAGPLSALGQPFLRAIEVQVLDHAYGKGDWFTTHGDVFPIHGSTMLPFGRHAGQRSFPSEERSKGSPQWNHYRITGQDGTLRLAVNGKEVSGGESCSWRKGYLALESEGGVVDWRNLRLKELPHSNATAEQSAPLADGRVSLYDGRSLTGWSQVVTASSNWVPKDWELVCVGGGTSLVLNQKLGDFTLQLDVRSEGKEEASPLPVCLNGVAMAGRITEKWSRYQIVRRGDTLSCHEEGQDLSQAVSIAAGPAEISLKSTTPLRVASLYLKEE